MITRRFEKLLNEKVIVEPRDEGQGYSAWNDAGIEAELGEYLYGLVRLLKPHLVLETGSHWGIACSYIAEALKDNEGGKIDTIEYEYAHIIKARDRISRLGLENWVNFIQGNSLTFDPKIEPEQYDLIWLDTEPQIRFQELVRFYPQLKPGGFVFIHDAPPSLTQGNINPDHPEIPSWPFGNLPQEMKNWVKDGDLRPFHLPNPRGTVGFYKPRLDEYKWR